MCSFNLHVNLHVSTRNNEYDFQGIFCKVYQCFVNGNHVFGTLYSLSLIGLRFIILRGKQWVNDLQWPIDFF